MTVEEKTTAQQAAEYEEFAGYAAEHDESIGTEATALLQALLAISHRLADLNNHLENIHRSMGDGTLLVDH